MVNSENAGRLIEFARTHTKREVEFEVARMNPRAARERIKPVNGDEAEVTLRVSRKVLTKLERVKVLEANRGAGELSFSALLEGLADFYMQRKDPVVKADRNSARAEFSDAGASSGRKLAAHEVHAVNFRDRGQCTHVDMDGVRCSSERWVQIHHIRHFSRGGSNHPDNLTTYCSFHHSLVHE